MKKSLRLIISLALSGGFMWLAFRKVDLSGMWDQLQNVQLPYVLFFVGALLVIHACRILRWDVLTHHFAPVPFLTQLRISNLGMMLILVLPFRLGEFARPYLLKKETGARMSAGLGAAVVERSIDGLVVTAAFFVTATFIPAPYVMPGEIRAGAWIALALFGASTTVVIAALISEQWVLRVLRRIGNVISEKLTEKALGMLEAFIHGVRSLPDWRAVAKVLALTFTYWAANGLGYYMVMRGFGWDVPIVAGFILVCIIVLVIMIPAGPGHLGTFQSAVLAGLLIFEINATDAAAYGMVVYPLTVLQVVGCGLPYVFGGGSQVTEIMHAGEEAEPEGGPA